ncbi:MAG: hypothetical protein K6E62_04255 [Lachnospiraceae bacterium]|nr:hypothetical protein [Lachnospiraceae bacterium]
MRKEQRGISGSQTIFMGKILLSAVLCALLLIAAPVLGASADDWWDDYYWEDDYDNWYPDYSGSTDPYDWPVKDHVLNFRTTESTIYTDSDYKCKLTVMFDLDTLPVEDMEKNTVWGIFITSDPNLSNLSAYSNYPSITVTPGELRLRDNSYTLEFDIAGGELAGLSRYLNGYGDESADLTVCICEADLSGYSGTIPKSTPSVTAQVKASTTDNWDAGDAITDIQVNNTSFSMGSVAKIIVSFNCKKASVVSGSPDLVFTITGDDGNTVITKTVNSADLKEGKNEVDLSTRFAERGLYELRIDQVTAGAYDSYYGYMETESKNLKSFEITVKKATAADGTTLDLSDSIFAEYGLYSQSQAKGFKIRYTVSDSDSKYHLFVVPGRSLLYEYDKKKILPECDFMSALGEMPVEPGKTNTLTVNTKFDKFGMYTLVLYNITARKKVAESIFYVVPEKYLIQRDISKMTDQGMVPFNCTAKVSNLDLDSDGKISFKVEFPLNYGKYYDEFKYSYGAPYEFFTPDEYATGKYSDDMESCKDFDIKYDDYDYGIDDIDDSFFTDDYEVNMLVKYVPAGSKEIRLLSSKRIKGLYKSHSVEFTAEELAEAIYSTSTSDTSFAGTVTVTFTNDFDLDTGSMIRQDIYNDAIVKFTESFSFGVYKNPKIKSAKAASKSIERAYGEYAAFTVTDTLGGTICADIYKGKKKIRTVKTDCSLNKSGTATGTVLWDLQDSKGKYVGTGKYKVKLYTTTEYPVFDENGKQSKKTVKSAKKTISFKIVKPSEKLTLSTSAIGSSGEGYVYIESPQVGINTVFSIGSKVSVSVKNSSGKTIDSGSFIRGKGNWTYWTTLPSGLSAGTYKAEVTAKTLDGTSKTSTTSFEVKKLPKPSISNASASADVNTGLASFSFNVSQYSNVTVTVKSGSTTKQTVLNQTYSAGKIKSSFSIGDYAVGKYDVVITASNSGGSSTVTKTIEVKKKPVVVKKPTASNLSIRILTDKNGESYKSTFNYTGKNSKVVLEVMWNDTEEIVYTYEGTTKSDSGTYSYTWDGYKSNGFRARAGEYTIRVHLVNSAGKTEYLRRNFTIGEG